MATRVVGVNPAVLRWARERAGYSREEVGRILGKTEADVASWEEVAEPALTYGQLERLAYGLYRRPLAIFFFPHPPVEVDVKSEFRLLPGFELDALSPDTLLAAREGLSMQESLRELAQGQNPAPKLVFRDIDASRFGSLGLLCRTVREYLEVDLDQQKSWKSVRIALRNWRDVLEAHGIYVFKRSFEQRSVSGLCLFDSEFPIILINNSTSDSRQVFTLFHELAHLLYGVSGVTKLDDTYVEALQPRDREVEMTCSRFAGAFLVPDWDFDPRVRRFAGSDREVEGFASLYCVSREAVLRKLLDLGVIDRAHYERKSRQWSEEYETRPKTAGGNYYATQATYLGTGFLRLAFSSYYEGRCSLEELASHLGVRARNVERLEAFVTRGG